jgi:hypothetical protein
MGRGSRRDGNSLAAHQDLIRDGRRNASRCGGAAFTTKLIAFVQIFGITWGWAILLQ